MRQSDYSIKDLKRFDKEYSNSLYCTNCGAKMPKLLIIGSGLRIHDKGASWIHTIDCKECNIVTEHSLAL